MNCSGYGVMGECCAVVLDFKGWQREPGLPVRGVGEAGKSLTVSLYLLV